MPQMTVPEGCTGLSMADGTRYNADRTGRVRVADRHVRDVRAHYGPLGLIDASDPKVLGTRGTRWCTTCQPSRAWNAWTLTCPRCGATTHEQENT